MANMGGRRRLRWFWGFGPEEREYLERQVRWRRVARSMSERCRIILRCIEGAQSKAVAAELGVHEHTVGKWRRRFRKDRMEGLLDEDRPGGPRTIDDDQVARGDRADAALDRLMHNAHRIELKGESLRKRRPAHAKAAAAAA